MDTPQFLSLNCPKIRGESDKCNQCPLLFKNLCEEFCDYLSYDFKGVKKSAGQQKMTTPVSYTPPLLPMFLEIEKNLDYTPGRKKSFPDWLRGRYGQYSFLSIDCPERNGKHERCYGCPVQLAGQCNAFVEFVSNNFFSPKIHNESFEDRFHNEEDDDLFMELFRTIENNFTYSGIGTFQGWVNTIYSKKKLKKNHNESRKSVAEVLNTLNEYPIEILAGKHLLDRKVDYAMVPHQDTKQQLVAEKKTGTMAADPTNIKITGNLLQASWEMAETLVAVSVNKQKVMKYLPLSPSLSLLVYGKANNSKASEILAAAKSAMVQNKGVLLRWNRSISGASVREILEAILEENGRMSLQQFIELTGEIEILTGDGLLADRMINQLSCSCTLPGDKTENSLMLIDIRREKLLTIVSHMTARNVLVHGIGEYGKMKKQLLATLESAASNMQEKSGVLIWLKEDLYPDNVKTMLQGVLRQYIDENVVAEKENQDGSSISSPLDGEKIDTEGGTAPDIEDTQIKKELNKAVQSCLENELTDQRLKKCTTIIYLYLTIHYAVLKKPELHKQAFLKNGKVQEEYIYKMMGEQLGIKQSAAKKRYLRCLKKGYSPGIYLRDCLAEHL